MVKVVTKTISVPEHYQNLSTKGTKSDLVLLKHWLRNYIIFSKLETRFKVALGTIWAHENLIKYRSKNTLILSIILFGAQKNRVMLKVLLGYITTKKYEFEWLIKKPLCYQGLVNQST